MQALVPVEAGTAEVELLGGVVDTRLKTGRIAANCGKTDNLQLTAELQPPIAPFSKFLRSHRLLLLHNFASW